MRRRSESNQLMAYRDVTGAKVLTEKTIFRKDVGCKVNGCIHE